MYSCCGEKRRPVSHEKTVSNMYFLTMRVSSSLKIKILKYKIINEFHLKNLYEVLSLLNTVIKKIINKWSVYVIFI